MVVDGLQKLIFSILESFVSLLPDVTWSADSGALSYFISIIKTIAYFLPMDHVSAIFSIIVSLMTFRIIVSLLRTIWDVLPLV